jgi:phosphatidylserine decarboxylase
MQVRIAAGIEGSLARSFDANLTVSMRFKQWLQEHWKVHATVLYDKAPYFFRPVDAQEVCVHPNSRLLFTHIAF